MKRSPELEAIAANLGRKIRAALPENVVFIFMLTEQGDEGWMTWITNGKRPDVVMTVKEFLVKLELQQAGEERTI